MASVAEQVLNRLLDQVRHVGSATTQVSAPDDTHPGTISAARVNQPDAGTGQTPSGESAGRPARDLEQWRRTWTTQTPKADPVGAGLWGARVTSLLIWRHLMSTRSATLW